MATSRLTFVRVHVISIHSPTMILFSPLSAGTFGMVRDSKGVLKPAALGLNDVFKSLPEFQHPDMPVWDLIQWGMVEVQLIRFEVVFHWRLFIEFMCISF